MRWTQRARIQKLCAGLPKGDVLYTFIQRHFGTLRAACYI